MNLKLLALDTSTAACSVALYVEGTVLERYHYAPRLHGELILSMINELLSDANVVLQDMHALAFGCGPGSFTGVRMASSVVQGLALGIGKPVIAVSSLQAMAYQFYMQAGYAQIACAFDARMQEVYWGTYRWQAGTWAGIGHECNIAPAALDILPGEWIGVGDGWNTYAQELAYNTGIKTYYPRCYPHAAAVARLAVPRYWRQEYTCVADALPVYLRNKVTR